MKQILQKKYSLDASTYTSSIHFATLVVMLYENGIDLDTGKKHSEVYLHPKV